MQLVEEGKCFDSPTQAHVDLPKASSEDPLEDLLGEQEIELDVSPFGKQTPEQEKKLAELKMVLLENDLVGLKDDFLIRYLVANKYYFNNSTIDIMSKMPPK